MAGWGPVRVALLSDCYLPRLGGIEVQVHDLAAQLLSAGHEVEVFTATPGAAGERGGAIEDVDGIPVHRVAVRMPWELPVNPWAPPEVRKRLVAGRFDVAHVHMGVVSPFATDMVAAALDVHLPTAVTWHCVLDRAAPIFRVLGHARRWAGRGAALSAVSSLAALHLHPVVGGVPVAVLPNGIDVADWAPEGPTGRDARTVRVVSAMRLAGRKRPGLLLDVAQEVRDRLPGDVRLEVEVYGEGPLRGRLERQIRAGGMADWVRLPGRVDRDELPGRYHRADVYVSSGRLEAFGIAALEARTAGLPVVAVAGSGVEDFVVDGVSGILARDDADLADQLARLVTDTDLRRRIAHHNATTPPAQDWPTVVEQVLAEYRRAQALAGATA